jgi:hypothetical protein
MAPDFCRNFLQISLVVLGSFKIYFSQVLVIQTWPWIDIINQVVSGMGWPAFRRGFDVILSTSGVSKAYFRLGVSCSIVSCCHTPFWWFLVLWWRTMWFERCAINISVIRNSNRWKVFLLSRKWMSNEIIWLLRTLYMSISTLPCHNNNNNYYCYYCRLPKGIAAWCMFNWSIIFKIRICRWLSGLTWYALEN